MDLLGGDLIAKAFKKEITLSPVAFQFLASANRVQNQDEVVLPALKRGETVLSDRCFWSAVPYGLMDLSVTYSEVETQLMLVSQSLLSHYHQFVVPDMVFYIDIDPENALERIVGRKTNHDLYEKEEKMRTVVDGYRWLVKHYPEAFIVIDGNKPIDEVTADLIQEMEKKGI